MGVIALCGFVLGLATPTAEQAGWQDLELGMFIHFAPNTWQDSEYDKRTTPLEEINPEGLDTEQWVEVAESMGAKYIVFVAKHVGGFCMWRTDTTDYSIKNTRWRGGEGDVLGDLAASCKKRGMGLGVYLSPRDDHLGAATSGRCATVEAQAKYNQVYRKQLTEVLSGYGTMMEVWFDGSNVIEVGDILAEHAGGAMIFQGKYATIRWVGNEEGIAPYPAWNCVSREAWQRGATAKDGDPEGEVWLPNECDARIRDTWFWHPDNADKLKSVDQLMEMYYGSVGRGGVLLLNQTPDMTGRIPEADAKRAAEFGAEIRRRFGTSIAETSGNGAELVLEFDSPQRIDHVVLMEDIQSGERVRSYVVEAKTGGQWRQVAEGSAVGHKKIDRIEAVEAGAVRLRVLESAGEPRIRRMAVFMCGGK